MCLHHALAWSESGLCRDVAQHNSGASLAALSEWLSARVTPASRSTLQTVDVREVHYPDVPALSHHSVP
jgi:hypothetical protein